MRSPADGAEGRLRIGGLHARAALELGFRLLALGMILFVLSRVLQPANPVAGERAAGPAVTAALEQWSVDPEVSVGHLSFAAAPSAAERDWLRALRGAGMTLGYDTPALSPLALTVAAVPDPVRPLRVLVAAPAGAEVEIRDAIGVLDTIQSASTGGELRGTALASTVVASLPGGVASAAVPDSLILRPLLVLGRAGWESKFTIAALEERGWSVVARLVVAPDVNVVQGAILPLDTARLSAVVALDGSAASLAPAIVRYVRDGGGLVLGVEAARIPALAALAPATASGALPLASDELAGPDARLGLPLHPLVRLREDALPLERRGDVVAVAARRVASGRVVQSGYDETWRWRMAGPDGAVEAHRAWWAAVVASVARAPSAPPGADMTVADGLESGDFPLAAGERSLDDAPLARLIAAVGEPSMFSSEAAPFDADASTLPWWALAIALAALLGEWASRRLRGVR